MFAEFLFSLIALAIIALLLRLIIKDKGQWNVFKSVQSGVIILIVIILLMLLLKR